MSTRTPCEQVRALGAELALGVADGKERAQALAHLAACPACRRYVAELTNVAEEVLALTPDEEPPAGFETRVLDALGYEPDVRARPPRWTRRHARPLLAAAAACLVAVAATASLLLVTFRDERELAGQYRAALERVGGDYFQAARLRDRRERPVGQVFGYQGNPSWLFIVVYEPFRHGPFTGALSTRGGAVVPLDGLDLDARSATWGAEIPIDLSEVAVVQLTDRAGNEFRARIPGGPSD